MNWTPEQQKEHRKLWVEALRSGKYKQARKQLRDGDAFCCLGVACEISGITEWFERDEGDAPYYLEDNRMLPRRVRHWLGLRGKMGGYGSEDSRLYLTDMNDAGMPFDEIADIIESEPEGLLA